MTIAELKEFIKDLPDDMYVGGLDKDDEYLEAGAWLTRPNSFDDDILCMWYDYSEEHLSRD